MNQKTNTKLSIDVINRYYYPVTAGIETFLLNVYPTLVKKGWNINMHASKNTLSRKGVLKDFEVIDGVNIHRYPLGLFGFFPKINWSRTKIVNLFNFDVFPHFYILSFSLVLKLLGKKKFIFIFAPHGGFTPEWSTFPYLIGFVKKTYHYTLGTFLINQVVDYIVPISEWERRELIKKGIYKPRIITIPNGIEKEAFKNVDKLASNDTKNKVNKFDKYIIQVGRIHPIKNYETSIHAISLLPKHIKLVIIGPVMDWKYKKKIDDLIKTLNLSDRIIFTGVVERIDKYFLIKKASLMIHTSLNESFCHVVNEGMSQGQICIVANNSNLPYLVKNGINGYLVNNHNYKEFAEKTAYVLKNAKSKEMQKMRARNKRSTLKYTWEYVSEQVDRLYKKII